MNADAIWVYYRGNADRVAVTTEKGVDRVVEQLLGAMK
jgi:hypothetical protein